jgi:hypothetical protein
MLRGRGILRLIFIIYFLDIMMFDLLEMIKYLFHGCSDSSPSSRFICYGVHSLVYLRSLGMSFN